MAARVDIISIGTLSRNRLWNEADAVRSAHATTTLIRAGKRTILVDPALPPPVVGARLFERTGLRPDKVGTIFLTNFRPAHRQGIGLFPHATILMHEAERDAAQAQLSQRLESEEGEADDAPPLREALQLLRRARAADDKLADGVDLFPLPGYTAGTCGLLVSAPTTSTLIAGDAVPTLDHFLAGQVLPDAAHIKAAQEAMAEVYEIADLIVPGHDNWFLNPRAGGL